MKGLKDRLYLATEGLPYEEGGEALIRFIGRRRDVWRLTLCGRKTTKPSIWTPSAHVAALMCGWRRRAVASLVAYE